MCLLHRVFALVAVATVGVLVATVLIPPATETLRAHVARGLSRMRPRRPARSKVGSMPIVPV